MNDTVGGEIAVLIASGGAMLVSIGLIFTVIRASGKIYSGGVNMLKNGASRIGNTLSKAGSKAIRNNPYGVAVQKHIGQYKAGVQLKGQQIQRDFVGKHPWMNVTQGQRQMFDADNAKNFSEEVGRAKGMMSLNVARSFGDAGSDFNLQKIRDQGYYDTHNGARIVMTQEDQHSLNRLETAGFMGTQNNRSGAAAASDILFDNQFIGERDIKNLSAVAGSGAQTSALMTEHIRDGAARNNYKNWMYGHVENGKYYDMVEGPSTKDAVSIAASGTQGVKKEFYETDAAKAGYLQKMQNAARMGDKEQVRTAVTELARRMAEVEKDEIVVGMANAVGIEAPQLLQLRQAVQTNSYDSKSAEVNGVITNVIGKVSRNELLTSNGTKDRDDALTKLNGVATKRINGNIPEIQKIIDRRNAGTLTRAEAMTMVKNMKDFKDMLDNPEIQNYLNRIP